MMEEESARGLWAAFVAGISTFGVIVTAWIRAKPSQEQSARASLDRTSLAITDGLRADIRRTQQQCERLALEREQWERAARGMDEIARDQWHTIANGIQAGALKMPTPPRVPRLESFFDADAPTT